MDVPRCRVHSRDATSGAWMSTRRPDLDAASRLRDSGSSRSFPQRSQTADKRASGDYVTLGGRKSALLLLSPTTDTATTSLSRSLSSSPPPPSPPPRTFTNDRLLTSAADCLQTNPPTFPNGFYDRAPHSLGSEQPPWIDLVGRSNERTNERRNEGTIDRSVAAMSLQLVELTRQTALRKIAGSQKAPAKENDSRLNASLRNCPNSSPRPPHFRRPTMSNSIPFHSTLRTVPVLTSSPPLFLSPIPLFTTGLHHPSSLSPSRPT